VPDGNPARAGVEAGTVVSGEIKVRRESDGLAGKISRRLTVLAVDKVGKPRQLVGGGDGEGGGGAVAVP
jgi:hypothetical protein